jgi:hypothetical protein
MSLLIERVEVRTRGQLLNPSATVARFHFILPDQRDAMEAVIAAELDAGWSVFTAPSTVGQGGMDADFDNRVRG